MAHGFFRLEGRGMKKSFWLLLLAVCMTALAAAPGRAEGVHGGCFPSDTAGTENAARPGTASSAGPELSQPDDQYDSLYDDAGVITPAFKRLEALYKTGDIREAYAGWLQLARQGDMFAMATLAAVSRAHAGQVWPVPPEFWENWILALLGEGEGGYVLGVQYAMLNGQREPAVKSGEFFLQSARTGHWAGMDGAFVTVRERENASFTLPATPPVAPIPTRFIDDRNDEARYWLTKAADTGYWKAAGLLAAYCVNPRKGTADYARAEHYAVIAAENGSVESALALGTGYAEGIFQNRARCDGYFTYMLLADRLRYHSDPSIGRISSLIRHIKSNPECQEADTVAAALAESKRLYEIWKSRRAGQQREKAALYARAAKRLPEVVAAYEKALHEGAVRH